MLRNITKLVKPLSRNDFFLLSTENTLHQQLRTTYIVKRRIQPFLHKQGEPRKKLKTRHYLYDLVKDSNNDKKPDLQVILTSFVEGVGNVGDKVSVRPNYAYNELLLPGLAVYATPENEKKYENVERTDMVHYSSAQVPYLIDKLSRLYLDVVMNKDSPWILQPWHIRASLRKCGYIVPEYALEMPQKQIKGPDMNLENKDFFVTVTINKTEKVKVRCTIHHWSTDITERLPPKEEHWKKRGDLLFPEDEEISKTDTTSTI